MTEPLLRGDRITPAAKAMQVVVFAGLLSTSTMALASPPPTTTGVRFQKPELSTASTPPQFVVPDAVQVVSQVDSLFDLKSQSGLTWDELAQLFGVSRRSLHHWMNGKPLSPEHENTLGRLRAFILYLGQTDHMQVRSLLLAPTLRGKTVFDLLVSGDYETANRELSRLPVPTNLGHVTIPDPSRPHPLSYLEQADITVTARPARAKGKRMNIQKSKSRG